jgi:hypothetical protein
MEIEKQHCAYGFIELAQSTGQWWPLTLGHYSMWPVRTLGLHST